MKLPKDLKGDGRRSVAPAFSTPVPAEARCRKVTLMQARMIVRELIDRGQTTHSAGANTMWVPLEWAWKNGRKCEVERVHGEDGEVSGYVVHLVPEEDETHGTG